MDERVRASLLWGLVGALSFLVLVQGYELVARPGISLTAKAGVAVLVGLVATGGTYAAEGYLEARAS